MKVKVLKNFRDSQDTKENRLGRLYKTLEIADFNKKRADNLISKGYVKKIETKKEAPKLEDKDAAPKVENKKLDL